MKKNPEQTAVTKKALMNSFWDIYQKKDINKITIGEIARTAGYNRGTFYEYFIDIYDVLDQIEMDLLDTLKGEIKQIMEAGIPNNIQEYSLKCARVFKKYDDKLFVLLGASGDSKFNTSLRNNFIENISKYFHIDVDIPNLDYLISFVYSSIVGVMGHWYEKDKDLTEEEFVLMVQTLITGGISQFTNTHIFSNTTL